MFCYIIISHGSKHVEQCVSSLLRLGVEADSVFVLENGPSKIDFSKLGVQFFRVENLGYLGTYLSFLKKNDAILDRYEYFFLCNADVDFKYVRDEGVKINNDIGLISPVYDSGAGNERYEGWSIPFSRLKFESFKYSMQYYTVFLIRQYVSKVKSFVLRSLPQRKEGCAFDIPHGSCVGIHKSVVQEILRNFMSKIPFLYFEEVFLYFVVRKLEKTVLFSSEFAVFHLGSETISANGLQKKWEWMATSYNRLKPEVDSVLLSQYVSSETSKP